ncbi:phosphoribosylamine--glycine ligase [Mycobacterium tuberculosis]|nr:phosphoribosylamine--glycine ligase [Mycobacterium tuberculosis]
MRVLVIGSGAREHALLLALGKDPQVSGLIVAPGNAGTARIAEQHDVDITPPRRWSPWLAKSALTWW